MCVRKHTPAVVRGMTLIEVVVAVVVLVVAFAGLFALFQASVRYVTTAQARETALSLAVERMEQMRVLPYSQVGTVGGSPSGVEPASETVVLDGISFTRQTLVQYYDDPADGTGSGDTDADGANDYKKAKVTVSWVTQAGTASVSLVSNFISH